MPVLLRGAALLALSALFLLACDPDSPAPEGDAGTPPRRDAGPTPEVDAGPPPLCGGEEEHSGEGTYYDADGSGNCSFPATPDDLMVAAMNHTDYAGSAACGACVRIRGPIGEVEVRIVDRCPECAPGDIDMSPQAFDRIAERAAGRVPIVWRYVPCAPAGPIVYHFKEGSNQWWTAVQLREHRHRIARFEHWDGAAWVDVAREEYNYFVATEGMGPGPYRFRVTDVYGHVLEDEGIPFVEAGDEPGAAQLPLCE